MLDLNTNGDTIREAILQIEKGTQAWLWLGYIGSSQTLTVKNSGVELSKMMESTTESEILYGYARVGRDQTMIAKYVFVLWLGSVRMNNAKIKLIKNGDDISRLFKTIHTKLSAHEASDVDWNEITQKLGVHCCEPRAGIVHGTDSDDDETPKPMQKVTDFHKPEMKGIVAARMATLYKQKTVSSYQPVDFRGEIKKALSMDHDTVESSQGAQYNRPDFRAEIAKREQNSHFENQERVQMKTNKVPHPSTTEAKASNDKVSASCATTDVTSASVSTGDNEVKIAGKFNFEGICIFPFEKALDDEISIKAGDRLTNVYQFDKAWLWGTAPNGESGRFPKSYVELFDENAEDL